MRTKRYQRASQFIEQAINELGEYNMQDIKEQLLGILNKLRRTEQHIKEGNAYHEHYLEESKKNHQKWQESLKIGLERITSELK